MVSWQPIELWEESVDGKKAVYALRDWPSFIGVSPDLINGEVFSKNEAGEFLVAVANGSATYIKTEEQPSEYWIQMQLARGNWRPPPQAHQTMAGG